MATSFQSNVKSNGPFASIGFTSLLSDSPETDSFGYQGYMNLDMLDDAAEDFAAVLNPAQNTAQRWSSAAAAETSLPLEVPNIPPIAPRPTQAGFAIPPETSDTRGGFQILRDELEAKGRRITGSEYKAMSRGRIDARARESGAQVANRNFKEEFFASRRSDADPSQRNIAFVGAAAKTDAGQAFNAQIERNKTSNIISIY